MRQTFISMFSTMLSLETPDPLLNTRLDKLATSLLQTKVVTPLNISFVLELFRYAAKNPHPKCCDTVYQKCLDLALR